jgi:hypothetical protein
MLGNAVRPSSRYMRTMRVCISSLGMELAASVTPESVLDMVLGRRLNPEFLPSLESVRTVKSGGQSSGACVAVELS